MCRVVRRHVNSSSARSGHVGNLKNNVNKPDLTILIVNYNGGDDILRCLKSLRSVLSEVEFEIIVVDNGSSDGSIDCIRTQFQECRLVEAQVNLGFAGGCNRGLADANGRHVLLLNPDTEIRPGALRFMVAALDRHASWGIVGARMLTPQGIPYRAARRFPTPFRLFCECTKLTALFPRSALFGGYFYGERAVTALDNVEQVEGSALMIRADVRTRIGELDPRFFVFFEEVDWCRRVREAGYEIHVVQEAEIIHHRATTMSRFYLQSRLYNAESACRYFDKWEGAAGVRRLKRWMTAALHIREAGSRCFGWLTRNEAAMRKAEAARAERDFYRGYQAGHS